MRKVRPYQNTNIFWVVLFEDKLTNLIIPELPSPTDLFFSVSEEAENNLPWLVERKDEIVFQYSNILPLSDDSLRWIHDTLLNRSSLLNASHSSNWSPAVGSLVLSYSELFYVIMFSLLRGVNCKSFRNGIVDSQNNEVLRISMPLTPILFFSPPYCPKTSRTKISTPR